MTTTPPILVTDLNHRERKRFMKWAEMHGQACTALVGALEACDDTGVAIALRRYCYSAYGLDELLQIFVDTVREVKVPDHVPD